MRFERARATVAVAGVGVAVSICTQLSYLYTALDTGEDTRNSSTVIRSSSLCVDSCCSDETTPTQRTLHYPYQCSWAPFFWLSCCCSELLALVGVVQAVTSNHVAPTGQGWRISLYNYSQYHDQQRLRHTTAETTRHSAYGTWGS